VPVEVIEVIEVIEVVEAPGVRLPATRESAAYSVVAAALTNAAPYANASPAQVRVAGRNRGVVVGARDDGRGDPAQGSGLRGLVDPVAALDRRLEVEGWRAEGAVVRAEFSGRR
jgi:signal transduction histidine kinase